MAASRARFIRPKYEAFQKWKNVVKLNYPLYERKKRYKGIIYELMDAKNQIYLEKHKVYKIVTVNENYTSLLGLGKNTGLMARKSISMKKIKPGQYPLSRGASKENKSRSSLLQTFKREQRRNDLIQTSTSMGLLADFNNNPSFKTYNVGDARQIGRSKSRPRMNKSEVKRSKSRKSVMFAQYDQGDRNPFTTPNKDMRRDRSSRRSMKMLPPVPS